MSQSRKERSQVPQLHAYSTAYRDQWKKKTHDLNMQHELFYYLFDKHNNAINASLKVLSLSTI